MSFDALAWAANQRPGTSAAKLVLLGLAECAGRDAGEAHPSTEALVQFSSLNRKTVIAALDRLEADGYIADTGRRVGRTGQVKVYALNLAQASQKRERSRLPKTEPSQKRNPPVFTRKGSQKRDTEPVKEPIPTVATQPTVARAPAKPDPFPCPDGVDSIDWDGLKANRKGKAPNTAAAHRGIVAKLDRWKRDGWPPGPIVANAAERGWRTVFETDAMKEKANGRTGTNGHAGNTPHRRNRAAEIDDAAARLGFG